MMIKEKLMMRLTSSIKLVKLINLQPGQNEEDTCDKYISSNYTNHLEKQLWKHSTPRVGCLNSSLTHLYLIMEKNI